MANNVTIRTTAPGAKEVAGQFKSIESAISGISPTAGKLFGALSGPLAKTNTQVGSLSGSLGGMASAIAGATVVGTALGTAAKDFGGFLAQAGIAAANEQENIAKLGAALKANIPAWNGDTTAIEAAIKRREDLAFSDDDLRDSLATLVASTHNVSSALQGQSLAMDIARARGISLNDASLLVAKTMSGNYVRAFKAAGLSVEGITDSTTALAALQKTYAGQAEAYAATTKGMFESDAIAIQDVNEELGSHMLPTFNRLAQITKTDVVPAFESVVEVGGNVIDWLTGTSTAGAKTDEQISELARHTGILTDQNKALIPTIKDAGNAADDAKPEFRGLTQQLDDAKDAAKTLQSRLDSLATDTLDAKYGARIDAGRLEELKQQLKDLTKEQRKFTKGDSDWVILDGKIAEVQQQIDETTGSILQLTNKPKYFEWLRTQTTLWDKAGNQLSGYNAELLQMIRLYNRINGLNAGGGGGGGGGGSRARAIGGPVSEGEAYIVGERGEEVFVPNRDGRIIPNDKLARPRGIANAMTHAAAPALANAAAFNGGPQVTVHVHGNIYGGPLGLDQLARDLNERLRQTQRGANYQAGRF